MRTDYRAYQPRIAVDVEINQQRDGDRAAFIIGTLPRLAARSYRVLELVGASLTPVAVCAQIQATARRERRPSP